VLSDHVDQLHTLAQALLEYETLSGDEIKELLDSGKLDRPDGSKAKPDVAPGIGAVIPRAGKRKGPFHDPKPQGA
jgi:cell division protease FtsH